MPENILLLIIIPSQNMSSRKIFSEAVNNAALTNYDLDR